MFKKSTPPSVGRRPEKVTPTRPLSRADVMAGLLLFAVTLFAYMNSSIQQIGDSRYSMLLSEHLLRHGNFDLKEEFKLPLDPGKFPALVGNGYPATTQIHGDHVYYAYPVGSSILSVPFVAILNLFGVSSIGLDGLYDMRGEDMTHRVIASILMAGLSVIFFFTGRLLLPLWASLLISLAAAFGTQMWSTASRALWSHTWQIFLLGFVVYLLVRTETLHGRFRPVALATLLSWAYFVRPTGSFPILVVTLYILICHRRAFLAFACTGATWLAMFLAYSWHDYQQILPPYYKAGGYLSTQFPYVKNFYAIFFSPSRGLLICVPLLVFTLYLLIRHFRSLPLRRLALVAIAVITMQTVILSFYPCGWTGGACFGSRYLTDTLPWLILLTILGFSAWRERLRVADSTVSRLGKAVEIAAGVILLTASVFINWRGATAAEVWMWTANLPSDSNVELQRVRVMDWRYPQWLAGWIPPSLPEKLPELPTGLTLKFGTRDADPYLREYYGWSGPEGDFHRTNGHAAHIIFALQQPAPVSRLELKLEPFIANEKMNPQRCTVYLNGHDLGRLTLGPGPAAVYPFAIPPGILQERNVLVLKLPDARSLSSLGISKDSRRMALLVYEIRLVAGDPVKPDNTPAA